MKVNFEIMGLKVMALSPGTTSVLRENSSKTATKASGKMGNATVLFIILGFGVFFFANGTKIKGFWENNIKQGPAIFYTDK
jgi:hypothetical protein